VFVVLKPFLPVFVSMVWSSAKKLGISKNYTEAMISLTITKKKKRKENFPQIHTRLLIYTLSMSEKKQNKIICFLYVRFVKNPKSFFHSGNR